MKLATAVHRETVHAAVAQRLMHAPTNGHARTHARTGFGDARRLLDGSDVQDELVRDAALLTAIQHLRISEQ